MFNRLFGLIATVLLVFMITACAIEDGELPPAEAPEE